MEIHVTGGTLDKQEIDAYIARGRQKYPGVQLNGIDIRVDGDFVELRYRLAELPPFQRIRRITGYLVGTMDKWNNGKTAEERDRVKHATSCTDGC